MECGSTADVEQATKDVDSLVFGEVATYACDAGYTVTGTIAGIADFEVERTAEGMLSKPSECKPVSAWRPPLCGTSCSGNTGQDPLRRRGARSLRTWIHHIQRVLPGPVRKGAQGEAR